MTPREEEPQIKVPMVDVFAPLPGRAPVEVERQVVAPLEKAFWSIPGVEYVYSTSSPGRGLRSSCASAWARIPTGRSCGSAPSSTRSRTTGRGTLPPPLVKPRSIDDVPVWALTFWSPTQDPATLRQIAAEVENEIKTIPEVSDTALIGGLRREFRVELDPARLAARGLAPGAVLAGASRPPTAASPAGPVVAGGPRDPGRGGRLRAQSAEELASVVVAESGGRPVRLADVARVVDGPEEPVVLRDARRAGTRRRGCRPSRSSVSKRRGANAITVVHAIDRKLEAPPRRGSSRRTSTRPSRATTARPRREKSNELLKHMALATLSVALLMALALGRREAGVVLLAVPVTLALTLFIFYLLGYTLNRITLFALIFSIGILVDDAIVVVENIVRHLRLPSARGPRRSPRSPSRRPTRSATRRSSRPSPSSRRSCPMGFVGGLMGPYMRPIPVGRLGGDALLAR